MTGAILKPTERILEAYPLSPLQQGFLFHSLSARSSGVDIEQILGTLHEDLHAPAFERAWQRLAERHAILRTHFRWEGLEEPLQEVQPHVRIHVETKDWSGLSPDERENHWDAYLESDRRRGFALTVAPLMRVALIRMGERHWQFVWTFHHVLLDGRAVTVLLNEVFAWYEAFRDGRDLALDSPRPYRDYIAWLQDRDSARAEAFWRQTLQGFTAPTPLVVTRPHPEADGAADHPAEQEIRLSSATTAALKSMAQENHLTLNTLVQAAWALLLGRYSGDESVVFGAIRACRRSSVEGAESIAGLFINTLPLRVRVTPDRLLRPWLGELREAWIALREYEHTSLVKIQGWSEVPRGERLFETLFNFQDPSWDAALRAQGGPWAERAFAVRSQSNYPLVVDAYGGVQIILKMLYHRRLFEDATITRMLGHFKTLIESLPAHLDQPLAKLPLLTEAERRQVLVEWNDTSADFSKDQCVHQLVAAQAARAPEALAVADAKTQLTFRELDQRANVLAQCLQRFGVGPDVRVGVCLDRSAELVVALLAVLKSGGAYVPLDPTHPKDRLAFMLDDAKIPVLVTDESVRAPDDWPAGGSPLICVNPAGKTLAPANPASLPCDQRAPRATDLAYVIYTSGSTGTPKGVPIEHASLLNLVTWHQRTYGVIPTDRATQIANPAFDASVWELWPYLTAGASIHIPDEATRLSPGKLLSWLADQKITLAFVPTPLAEAILNEPAPDGLVLRALLTGGDKLHRAPGENFPCALVNHYGPTENTVVTTWFAVPPAAKNASSPPIGRPIANTRVYVLDRQLQPVPIGVPGELHVGGAGLARGYLNRSELTAAKFIPSPFGADPPARLYKTGDLVRWLPDGAMEFLGRIDHQVKIRGHRIELGEIESLLSQCSSVREAAVVTREDAAGEHRLAAYVVPARPHRPSRSDLREFLKRKLPDSMLPSAWVFLDALPLTPNGKINHAALPAPAPEPADNYVAPRTPTEDMLAGLWSQVLGLPRVGVNDDFFELGGHSLLAMQVVSRLQNALQAELTVSEIFAAPTVAALAKKIEAARLPSNGPACPRLAHRTRNGERPLSFAQERLWFLEQLEPGAAVNNIPIAIRLEGTLNPAALEQSLRELVGRHETLRTVFRSNQGRPIGVTLPAGSLAVAAADLTDLPGAEREARARRMMTEEAERPFDLTQGPLLRATVLRLNAQEHLLLLTAHHIACDGWSMGIFYRELTALYGAFAQDGRPALPALAVAYADFADWQRLWLQGEILEKQIAYWRRQLDGAALALELPTDRPRPPLPTYRGAAKCFALPAKLSAELAELARKEDVTLFMLLLAAFQTLLHRYSGQDDILVGSPTAGRTRVETEELIGLFVNTLVLRGDLAGDPSFRELLRRVRRVALDAYAHQDVPFEKLVDALRPERDLSRSPVFQVMFILQNEPLPPLELTGLKMTPLPVHSGTAKFDLTLSLQESGGGLHGFIEYNSDLFGEPTVGRMLGHFQTLLEGLVLHPEERLSRLPLLTPAERNQLLAEWNDTRADFPRDRCIHHLFEEQAGRTPEATAVVFEDEELTYRQLNERANQLAHALHALGVHPDRPVGICAERSLEMIVGLLAILKAGGCYLPLDPAYPRERLAFMLQNAQARVMLVQEKLREPLRSQSQMPDLTWVSLDAPSSLSRNAPGSTLHAPPSGVTPDHLAYLMYTSGSTGEPKGVMVTHRNVVNCFTGLDRVIGPEPGVWLALTSMSFDISVLELFWTLARGFKVVLHSERGGWSPAVAKAPSVHRKIDFDLFYFASDAGDRGEGKYRLLLEGAKFADRHDFTAIWTPERHFHSFGGLYPNPSVTSAAVAMVTERIQIRAGSVVLPLHHPVRVAEEWSVVDNLSQGRIAIAFASGWHANDFVLAPDRYPNRRERMLRDIETVRRLWRGETLPFPGVSGDTVSVALSPRPVQRELPIWITSAGGLETFQLAGQLGANLLTHLLGQNVEELERKIAAYREAWRQARHPGEGRVCLMLHTFVSDDAANVRDKVWLPFRDYLRNSIDLIGNNLPRGVAPASPTASGNGAAWAAAREIDGREMDTVLDHAADRYFQTSSLFGTPRSCVERISQLRTLGVDEVACLIDFGIDTDSVLQSLTHLNRVREQSDPTRGIPSAGYSLAEQIRRHGVTHLQCTPSLAAALVQDRQALAALRAVRKWLLGGEALPAALVRQLPESVQIFNMYGPTETTIWSATHRVTPGESPIPIGRPMVNTEIYLLDRNLQPVPVGGPGEVFIGGSGVARGYWNRPELTAARFLRHPFRSDPDARVYRTGDLARFRPDGTIEFLGRLDQQVKLRGFRIELGEIESTLRQHPAVRECAVLVWGNTPDEKRLVAYVVAAPATPPSAGDLRRFAKQKLPDYMVPSAFVPLEKLPLTPNGKVDRKRLPEPDGARGDGIYIQPRTDLEKAIAHVWRELLHVEPIGSHDNFFDLGGHSLLVVQAQAKLRDTLGVELPVVRLFQYPTISALANFLSDRPETPSFQNVRARAQRQKEALARRPRVLGKVAA